jgi:hypothetical protein
MSGADTHVAFEQRAIDQFSILSSQSGQSKATHSVGAGDTATNDPAATHSALSCPERCAAANIPSQVALPKSPLCTRRRANPEQERALEKIGHATEYLVDSRMLLIHEPTTKVDDEALHLLMRLSRSILSECEEIIPLSQRLRQWLRKTNISARHEQY